MSAIILRNVRIPSTCVALEYRRVVEAFDGKTCRTIDETEENASYEETIPGHLGISELAGSDLI